MVALSAQCNRLIAMMDTNEHTLNNSLGQLLVDNDQGLGLVENFHCARGGREVNTHITGSKLIDGV